MKKLFWISATLLSLGTLAWVQVNQSAPPMASLMPAGSMIYLEAKDFHSLLDEWNRSGVKSSWLKSANYQVFSNSHLLQKLNDLYKEYGAVTGFLPGLPGTLEIAGRESALGLYDLPNQHFVYITRVEESQLTKSQLWAAREKFATRVASGVSFYLRRDDASDRTVAFAFTDGWLVLATRDDLMANTLALITRKPGASVAQEPWFTAAIAQSGAAGELRMALDMESLMDDVRFRSYWIQRNVPQLRPFNGALADVQRTPGEIAETRLFLRTEQQTADIAPRSAVDSLAALRALAPADAALVKGWAAPSADQVEAIVETKLLWPDTGPSQMRSEVYSPEAADTDQTAGSEQDLETRIDEPPLHADVSGTLKATALRDLIARAAPGALLQIQTTSPAGRFLRTPSVLVLSVQSALDASALREALSSAVETLWSTSGLGVGWQPVTLGQRQAERLDGLGSLLFAIDGTRLFLANDAALLQATLARIGTAPLPSGPSYTAEFRHAREQANYLRMMQALDFGARRSLFAFNPQGDRTPAFFSQNLGSLSSVFGFVQTMMVTRTETQEAVRERVVYR